MKPQADNKTLSKITINLLIISSYLPQLQRLKRFFLAVIDDLEAILHVPRRKKSS